MIYAFLSVVLIAVAVYIFAKAHMPDIEHLEIAKRLGRARPDPGKQINKMSQSILSFIERRVSRLRGETIENLRAKIKKMLDMAGNPAGVTVDGFFAICIMFSFMITVLCFMFFRNFDFFMKIMLGVMIGVILPIFWLKGLITKRHRAIIRSLPDVLDLVTLSMEAGIDFNSAITKVTAKSEVNPLTEELALMQQGIRLGQSRVAALEDMTKRIDNLDFTSVIINIIQAEKISSPLGPVLRIQSEQMRLKRFQLAEKLAQQAPIKMLFPLMFCILPSIFLMLFAPLALRVLYHGMPF